MSELNKEQQAFLTEFNWHNYAEGIDAVDQKNLQEFEDLVSKTFIDTDQEEVVEGVVVRITDRDAIVDINAKSEGVISLNEFRYNPNLKVGDKVEVLIDIREDKTGQLVLSHRKARTIKSWDRVISANETGEIVQGFVKCRTKGGMIVDVFGIEAFLPGSQIDVKPIRDYDVYVNKMMEFKDITSYGVFIDLGGVDGLIHITDLSWSRINHPSEVLELDQKLNVVILDFDDEKTRIQLGLKQLNAHPWDALGTELKVGDKVKGKVVVIADYGAFIEVAEGVEGLIHVSEMSWSTHLRSAQDFVKVSDVVEAVVLTLDRDERKMSLGIKQLTQDPWTDITAKYPIASKHTGIVRNFTNFGIFVELEEGIDGLVYISDLSWTKKIKHPSEFVNVGDKLEVWVLELDVEGRKLSLGHKQTTANPWDKHEAAFAVGTIHNGTIAEIVDKGATVDFGDDVVAFIPTRHLEKEDGKKLKKGDVADFKVIEFNKEFKRVVASHTAIFREEEEKNVKAATESVAAATSNNQASTLGDNNDILAELKAKMEKGGK